MHLVLPHRAVYSALKRGSQHTRQAIYVQTNMEAHSPNHCYIPQTISITYSECVSVALVIQQAMRMRLTTHCHLWPV
jgi:hypothetical protein